MSEEESELPERIVKKRHDEVDWVLESLVSEANTRRSAFVDITLHVHGLIVSGTLVGITEYYKSVVGYFHKGEDRPSPGTWGEFFQNLADELDESLKEETQERLSYIHLKNAKLFKNGARPMPSNQGVWWRGKISSVDGFWLGKLKSVDDDE